MREEWWLYFRGSQGYSEDRACLHKSHRKTAKKSGLKDQEKLSWSGRKVPSLGIRNYTNPKVQSNTNALSTAIFSALKYIKNG